MYDVTIIGAGVIGTFIARELSKYQMKILLLDKENDISKGATRANSAIIHGGYDAKTGTLMAKFNALGNPMFDKICDELKVPFKRVGSLVVAFDNEDMETINKLYERGVENGIPDVEILLGSEIKKMEPNISRKIIGGLYSKTAGIIGPWELAIALAENAMENGVELSLNTEVQDVQKNEGNYRLISNKGQIDTKYVINCAGIYADKINNMVSKESFTITPRRGEYYVLDKGIGVDFMSTVIFQCPTKLGKGILLAPTVHGNMLIGPNAENIQDKEGIQTTYEGLEFIKNTSNKSSEDIPFNKNIRTFAGLRAHPSTGDFIIGEVEDAKGFINVAGIKSPGLSSSPAIAEYVVNLLLESIENFNLKEDFNPYRQKPIVFMELNDRGKNELINRDDRYGRIICRCEMITEGEIVDTIKRPGGATTVDGIKRRVRPGAGRCQGAFCGPRIVEILARELDKDPEQVLKDGEGSNILIGETNKGKLAYGEV
ncbi:NAD(P)/FAD-dependent oxidoreductase [Clostridium sp. D2Q-11]|uniref:NAD(P)/FAD-dependent oxidoreductase n=1 Tax=Anaeromonas frigoriresistens TaxID=2683708 RepID=A0A942UZZ0_9FIRM|nr:NAD(P)/FAD-dependent oxidoreductase [Anaeromonas frigoriresistens]MBS4538662.1 NAD(P)/FAD-dependent oxidoreductase [Anaeromonas frigoriresistens]